jgi:spore germination cell wall hydrolase CwlJ-like protein
MRRVENIQSPMAPDTLREASTRTGASDALAVTVFRANEDARERAAVSDQQDAVTLIFSRREPPATAIVDDIALTAAPATAQRIQEAAERRRRAALPGARRRRALLLVTTLTVAAAASIAVAYNVQSPGLKTSALTTASITPVDRSLSQLPHTKPPTDQPSAATSTIADAVVPVAAHEPVDDLGRSVYAKHFAGAGAGERACLAKAIYHEARGETYEGQVAVGQVIANRTRLKGWPDTICGVVHQGADRGEKCQFSFVCRLHLSEPSGELWDQAKVIAEAVLAGNAWLRETMDATHYHTVQVAPIWRLNLTPIRTVGSHIFYRETDGHMREIKPYGAARVDRVDVLGSGQSTSATVSKAPEVASKPRPVGTRVPTANANAGAKAAGENKDFNWSAIQSQN